MADAIRQALLLGLVVLAPSAVAAPAELAGTYSKAIEEINSAHLRKPGKATEAELARGVPKAAARALDALLAMDPSPEVVTALLACGEASLALDLAADFARVRARLLELDPAAAAELGTILSAPRFQLRGLGGLDTEYLARFAEVFDLVLASYDEVFGFREWSKVPGKKLRVRVHLEGQIQRPPHFAPQFPFHSEIDFPVIDAEAFKSPTADGKFLFYGLCHELGHVIAMWGDRSTEEDHHAWAHYTGLVIVEHLSEKKPAPEALAGCRDVRWRNPAQERERLAQAGAQPSLADRDGVLALLFALHDIVGPAGIGRAMNQLDSSGRNQRVNQVRYYRIADLGDAALAAAKGRKQKAALATLLKGL